MRPQGPAAADAVASSPPPSTPEPPNPFLSPTRSTQPKERRVPSVTPRRFRRFFTPRPLPQQTSRTTLGVMDSVAVNRQMLSPQSLAGGPLSSDPICPSSPTDRLAPIDEGGDKRKPERQFGPPAKRRRGVDLSDLLPPLPCAPADGERTPPGSMASLEGDATLSERRKATLSHFFKSSRRGLQSLGDKWQASAQHPAQVDISLAKPLRDYRPQPIRKLRNRGFEARLLDREHGFSSHTGKQHLAFPAPDPTVETAGFYSDRYDSYFCTPVEHAGTTIPFSLASCRRSDVTAIGDEHGFVRLFSTAKLSGPGDKVATTTKVHDNAIMDLDLSGDDSRLASACGDRSGRILDMQTQTVAVELGGGHWDSLRQVTFQPGRSGDVLASSDRAGRVQVWDLRYSSLPALCFSSGPGGLGRRDDRLDIAAARTVNTIDGAHERTIQGSTSSASVTALQWMAAGREHLLLTASEANACIKLWDTRYIKPRRQTAAETPVAATPAPATHAFRSYGITSLALGNDAARLYAVCKDSTVYAYSTNHLVLGLAPDLLEGAPKRKPAGVEGLGPLYGLKHDSLRVASFYVKCAIRPGPASDGAELLAVGSSDGCAVLFPTDERYMRAAWARREHVLTSASSSSCPPSSPGVASGSPPILRTGTPLVSGHSREVTTLSWSHDGKLVTASDDYSVRQWQWDAGRARHLRQVGDFGGERYNAGWAKVSDGWDEDEC
ncbi:hypothetical protein CDD83_1158 [Cordyceps sp. RAO-2017]|nr:hypothetical protein CDD83_1158 [Cordyceps sp. RAO-2017]